jgi:hypothetical protein
MAASAWAVHDKAKLYVGNKVIDFDLDTFYMILGLDGGNMHAVTTDPYLSVTSEVATNFGYNQGIHIDNLITNNSWADSGSTVTFDHDDVVWTADQGDITARYAAVVDDSVGPTPVDKPVICSSLLDTAPADVTATDGNTFTVQINVSGVFTLA